MPSEKILAQKKALVEQLAEKFKNSCAGVFVEYKGITVEDDTKLRKELREANEDNMNTLKINDVLNDNDNNNELNTLKNKNKEYQEQINKLKSEIEDYKKKGSSTGGGVDIKKYEEIRHQNVLYYNKLQEAQKKIMKANALVGRAKKYGTCVTYISEFLSAFTPANDKQNNIFNELKKLVDEYEKEKLLKK